MSVLYFEDLEPGFEQRGREPYRLERDEVIEFARRWDPQPFHVDEAAAKRSIFGGLIACMPHIFAIQCILSSRLEPDVALLSGLGNEGFELRKPARPGDLLTLVRRVESRRESRSRPEGGVVKTWYELWNQDGVLVFRDLGIAMIARRAAPLRTSG
jgi:acyl dehydratase